MNVQLVNKGYIYDNNPLINHKHCTNQQHTQRSSPRKGKICRQLSTIHQIIEDLGHVNQQGSKYLYTKTTNK